MNKFLILIVLTALSYFSFSQPLSLHPNNPHYFMFKEKPFLLITSAEHYGAVLNNDFDYQ